MTPDRAAEAFAQIREALTTPRWSLDLAGATVVSNPEALTALDSLQAEIDRLRELMACADTPLMRDVIGRLTLVVRWKRRAAA